MSSFARWMMLFSAVAIPVGARGRTSEFPSPAPVHAWLQIGTPDIKAAGALTFTPDGLLLVGDSPGSAVFAIDVRDAAPAADTATVKRIDELVAARLGTTASEIAINDMAVHPRSHAVYLSVSRGLGAGARPAIVRVGAKARVDVVSLTNIPFAKAVLPHPPGPGTKDDDGDDISDQAITGLAVVGGSLYVAGISSDEFASTLRRVAIPFTPAVTSTGLRIYHTHHSRFETKSPISAMTPYSAGGRDYLLVSYSCTPLAIFAVDSLADGAKVTGRTIAELGAGTHATSMFTFEFKGTRFLAVNTIGRSIQMLEANDLAAAPALGAGSSGQPPGMPLGSWLTWGVRAHPGGVAGVLRAADFNATHAVALQRAVESGILYLRPLQKPLLWGQNTSR